MTGMWMRGAAVAALGWAMLAGAAQATVVTYNFTAPINAYNDDLGTTGVTGTFAGSVQIDTAKLALWNPQVSSDPTYGYVYTNATSGPASESVTATTNVSGTPTDSFLNAAMPAPGTGASQLFQGTGNFFTQNYGGSYFELSMNQNSVTISYDANGGFAEDYDYREFHLGFSGATAMTVDGFVLPTPGTGTISAYLYRSRFSYLYDANAIFLGTASAYSDVSGAPGTTSEPGADPDPVPEPGALALLGLGVMGMALRRRRAV